MAQSSPNLLFVFADQMRGMDMGCAGNAQIKTPHLDALSREGVRLTGHIANNPVCGPNRATLLTGTYATTHRVLGNDLPIRPDLPSLGSVAQTAGYRTGYIGKWHLDGTPRTKFTPPGPRRLGFADWAVHNCRHKYESFQYYHDNEKLLEVDEYEPIAQTDLALQWLDAYAQSDQPFCLVLSWGPPHDPYPEVPDRYRNQYDPASLTLRPNTQPEADNPLATHLDCRTTTANYYAAITALDEQMGRLMAGVKKLGLEDDTLVVFTSDHGDMLWSHGLMKKQLPYEEAISIPCLMRWPHQLPADVTRDALIGSVDLLATLCGLMGLTVPDTTQGLDFSQYLSTGSLDQEPASVLIGDYLASEEANRQAVLPWRGVRTPQYTYVEQMGRRPWLLFDNHADPFQMNNLIADDRLQPQRAYLASELSRWLERTGDPLGDAQAMLDTVGLADDWRKRCEAMGQSWPN